MSIKSLALVAAAVTTAGAAQAADLNKPAKAAVDYVKVCDAYGAGFFYIPGSDTCLKISGYVRVDYVTGGQAKKSTYGNTGLNIDRSTNAFKTKARGYVSFDARTSTSLGLLRSFYETYTQLGTGGASATPGYSAYLQLGGLTVGHTDSKFTFGDAEQSNQGYGFELFPDYSPNLIAYTYAFGNGITATVSVEDPTAGGQRSFNSGDNGGTFQYGALNVPDVVANINVTQSWGEAQLAVLYHQVYGSLDTPYTKSGFATFGGVLFNVPQFGAGDTVGIEGGYALGDAGAIFSGGVLGKGDVGTDAAVVNGSLKLSSSWTVGGVLTHSLAPNLTFHGSLGYYGWSNTIATGKANFGLTEASAQLDWEPVKSFHVKPDVELRSASLNRVAKSATGATNGVSYVFGVRLQRNF